MTPRALFHPARLARRPVLSTQSDARLVDLVRAGSEHAFETIVERYRRALMRYVSRLLPPERAEDVVQQSFVKAYEAMHRDGAELNLRPWLYRIAHNTALNALRDRGLRHEELDERIDGVERPDQALERAQGIREVLVAVQALPERQRDAIVLRELEGRSYEEIAVALGVTDGAVRQLLNRARNSLRAAAAAITPAPLLTRLASGESAEPVTARMAELGAAGGGALVAKVCATALVTGAVVGGAAVVPDSGRNEQRGAPVGAEPAQAAEAPDDAAAATGLGASGGEGMPRGRGDAEDRAVAQGDGRSGRREGDGDGRSGDDERDGEDRDDGEGDREDRDDDRRDGGRSGPGGGDDRDEPEPEDNEDHSGPGGGPDEEPKDADEPEDEPEIASDDRSGPSGGGSGSSGSGSGGSGSGHGGVPDPDELEDLLEPEEPGH